MTRKIFDAIDLTNKFETDSRFGFIFSYSSLDDRNILERIMDANTGIFFDIYTLSFNIEKDDDNYQTTITFSKIG